MNCKVILVVFSRIKVSVMTAGNRTDDTKGKNSWGCDASFCFSFEVAMLQ